MGRTIRLFIASTALGLILYQNADAGVICEAIGKQWDKAAGKIVKVHKACQAHLKEGLHHQGKLKHGKHRHR